MRATLLSGVMLAAAALAAPALVSAKGALDGHSYDVVVTMPNGRHEENTYSFKDGRLESAMCAIQGYPAAPYTAKKNGSRMIVTAVLENGRGDSRTVNAVVARNGMSGTVSINADGQTSELTFGPKAAGTAASKKRPARTGGNR